MWPYRNEPFTGGDASLSSISGSKNKGNLLFSWPELILECSSQSVNGITPQGDNSFLFLSSLINFLPYGPWQPVTHVSFQSFQMNLSPMPSQLIVSLGLEGKWTTTCSFNSIFLETFPQLL